jgi:hypothetical protein
VDVIVMANVELSLLKSPVHVKQTVLMWSVLLRLGLFVLPAKLARAAAFGEFAQVLKADWMTDVTLRVPVPVMFAPGVICTT